MKMGLGEPKKRPASDTAEQTTPCAACAVRDMAFCGVLEDHEMPHLLAIMQSSTVDAHGPIIDEGEPADYLFNVTEGAAKLYKLLPDGRRQITGFLFEGDFLGIAMNERYAYSAEAIGQVSLCRFPRYKLERLLDEFPKLEKRLLGMASNELVQAQDQILLLGRKTAQEKIVSFLLNLSDRAVKRGASATPISLPMGRADIADYLGLTTETVSRTITNLKRNSHIRLLQGGKVELHDREALQELAEGA
jgi:CRP/FNR family transcriptional regulator